MIEEMAKAGYDVNQALTHLDIDEKIKALSIALGMQIALHSTPEKMLKNIVFALEKGVTDVLAAIKTRKTQ